MDRIATTAFAGWQLVCPTAHCTFRRPDSLLHLPERGQQRVLRDAPHNRICRPAKGARDITTQRHRFQFHVHTAVAFLESGDAVEPPNVATPLIGWQPLFAGLAVVTNLLNASRISDPIPSLSIELLVASLVFAVQRGVGYHFLVY